MGYTRDPYPQQLAVDRVQRDPSMRHYSCGVRLEIGVTSQSSANEEALHAKTHTRLNGQLRCRIQKYVYSRTRFSIQTRLQI